MKKIFALILCLLLIMGTAACGGNSGNGKIKVIATVFPVYDWVREIAGGDSNIEISMLLDNGIDLHSFEPTAEDIINIATCDMFIYVGGESDSRWVDAVLAQKQNENMVIINLLDALGDTKVEEEIKEGMQAQEEEEGEDEAPGEREYDEHIWLSLKNAGVLCETICAGMCKANGQGAEAYKKNTAEYVKKLNELDGEYRSAVEEADKNTLIFADRFPFIYMAKDYGLDYYAAFSGCSTESDAKIETVTFLAGKADELGLGAIMKIEGSDGGIAEQVCAIAENKDMRILTLNSMQSVTSEQINAGATYLKLFADNLPVLKEALN